MNSDQSPTTLLFVYGTLRRDPAGRIHPLLGPDAVWHGMARWPGRLYRVTGDYPGAVPSSTPADLVHGELYALSDPVLGALDDYEDCGATDPEYRRRLAQVERADGSTVTAWVYVYARPVAGLTPIATGDFGPGRVLGADAR